MILEPGDVLIEDDLGHSGGVHALMWIDGDKPLLHTSNETFLGVFAQSMNYIGKRLNEEIREVQSTGVGVYRYKHDTALPKKAAEYAKKWATKFDEISKEGHQFSQRVLGTPFSRKRQTESYGRQKSPVPPVTVETIFRVLKAIARTENGMKLSPNHGVSCSQFVVYCYQAASLHLKFGGIIPGGVLASLQSQERKEQVSASDRLKRYAREDFKDDHWENSKEYWRDQLWWAEQGLFRKAKELAGDDQAVSLLNLTLKHDQSADFYKSLLPPGMDIDPLTYSVDYLTRQLKRPDSSFSRVGQLHGTYGADSWTIV